MDTRTDASSLLVDRAPLPLDLELRDDGWDATGVLVFATSLLSLGGGGLVLLLRVAGLLA
jgi:hypothetical protein